MKIPKLSACFVVHAVACCSALCPTHASQRQIALSVCSLNSKPVICYNVPTGRWFVQMVLCVYCVAIPPGHRFAYNNIVPWLIYVAFTQVHGVITQQSASVYLSYLVTTEQKNTVLLVVMLCNLVKMCHCFRGMCWLHLQSRWRWYVPTKQLLFTEQYDVISKKTVFSTVTRVKTPKLTWNWCYKISCG